MRNKRYLLILIALVAVWISPGRVFASSTYTCSVTNKPTTTLSPEFFGMFTAVDYLQNGWTNQQKVDFFQKIKDTGIYSVRIQLDWNKIEKSKGIYNWDSYDSSYKAINQVGLKAVPMPIGVPDWARPSTGAAAGKIVIDPQYYDAWQRFIETAVKRYSNTTGTVVKIASDWEIWNEPEYEYYYGGTPDELVTTLNLAYDVIKRTDPNARVWSPAAVNGVLEKMFLGKSSYPVSTKFFTEGIQKGKFDVLTIHLYSDINTSFKLTKDTKQYVRENGNALTANAKLAVTEANLHFMSGCNKVNSLSEQAMADMITNQYACLSQAGADAVYYFMALDLVNQKCSDEATTVVKVGILNSDLTPRTSYFAIKDMITTVTNQSSNPADLTDEGDTPGDEVNIFDYNVLVANFGNPYTIFDYNKLVENFDN